MEIPSTSDIFDMRKFELELKRKIALEIQHLKQQGYTDEDLEILFDGLRYISYPVLDEYFEEVKIKDHSISLNIDNI